MGRSDTALLEIESLAAGGRGLARHEGIVWFVSGAYPGDLVVAEPVVRRARHVEARVVALRTPSPHRREVVCAVQPRCGGCPWMPLDDGEQTAWKRRILHDALARIGRIDAAPIEPARVPGPRLGYRNRVEFTVRAGAAGQAVIGLHGTTATLPDLVDVERCPIQHPVANAVLASVRDVLRGRPRFGPGEYRLAIRRSAATGEILVVLHEPGRPFPGAASLARVLPQRHPEVVGVVRVRARPGRRGGARALALAGRGWIEERIAGISFRLPATTFVQVNPVAAEALVELVAEAAGRAAPRGIFDLYCGVGIYALRLAAAGAEPVTACDADAEAIACGRETARTVRSRVHFVHATVERFLEAAPRPPDVVVANPPRRGLAPGVARWIAGSGSARLVLVSCEPTTLARDVRVLVERGGYRLARVVPVDAFPQTAHLETVAVLERG